MALPRAVSAAVPASGLRLPISSPKIYFGSRFYTTSPVLRLSSKRKLVTTSVYRPETLQPPPPPPRNAGTPDTSISQSIPAAEISLPEGEAQKPKPAEMTPASTTPAAATTSTAKPIRSKLRPRKAAMRLTSTAITHLRDLLEQPEPKFIRVAVKNRGCSGLAYHLEYVDKPGAFDEAVEQDGVKVLIDSKALFSIIGSEMDWVEDKLNQRFVFRNPNISTWSSSSTAVAC